MWDMRSLLCALTPFCSRKAIYKNFLVICVWHIMQNSKWCDQNPLLLFDQRSLVQGRCDTGAGEQRGSCRQRGNSEMRQCTGSHCYHQEGTKVKGRRPHQTPGAVGSSRNWDRGVPSVRALGGQSCYYIYSNPFLPGHLACKGHLLCSLKNKRPEDGSEGQLT